MPVKKGKQAKQAKPKAKQSRKDHLSLSRAVVEESNDAEPQQPEDDVETVEKVKPGQKPKRTLDNTTADEDEMRLEALLFSDIHATEYDGLAVTRQAAQDVSEDEEDIDFANMDFIIDRTGSKGASNEPAAVLNAADVSVKEGDSDKDSGDDDDSVKDTTDRGVKRSVWEDADDHAIEVAMASKSRTRKLRKTEAEDVVDGSEYSDRLREQFKNTYSRTHQKWAEHVEEDVDGSELMGWSGKLLDGSKQELPKTLLDVTRVTDANKQEYSKSNVASIRFHPNASVAIVGGLDKTLRLFSIDGKANAKIQSIFIRDMPILSCEFSTDGSQIFISGRRPFFYSYNILNGEVDKVHRLHGRTEKSLESMSLSPCGKLLVFLGNAGSILLVDTKTKRLVHTLKMNGTSRAVTFSPDGSTMYSFGSAGDIYVWDMKTLRCTHKFHDDGCISGVQVTVSPDGRYLATGCQSGVINLYDVPSLTTTTKPKPLKTIMNITTRADTLVFNHDSQILAVSTKHTKDTLKLIHVASMTVFSNWPTAATPLRYVQSVAFSPNSGYMAIGNDRGHVLLYRLNHYHSA